MSDLSIEIDLNPAFHDCDPMQVVWHGNYFKYFEIARCALLQRYGYDYPQMLESGYLWPVVDARVKYIRPLLYQQALRVRARIVEWENRLKIDYLLSDAVSGTRTSKGYSIQVAVSKASGEMCLASPQVLLDKLGVSQ